MLDAMAETTSKPTKLLAPVDLSELSRAGVAYAAMLAASFDATLVLMTNVNLPELASIEQYAAGRGIAMGEAGEALLRDWADELAPGVEVEVTLGSHTFPADGILAVAKERDVDMIVVASHGRSGVSRWLLGSVAEKLARGGHVPIVIVPVGGRLPDDQAERT